VEDDLQILRALCDETLPREQRLKLLDSYAHHTCVEPEHQVVFESIRALFPRGPISAARLAVHLTNRGFPDIDIEKYCPAATPRL
jgi:hypothetical protein